jgi:hypothetical protein
VKKFLAIILLVISTLVLAAPAAIKNIDPRAPSITKVEAYWIYSLKSRHWNNGEKITVFMLDFDNPTHIVFVKNTLGMNPTLFRQAVESNINMGVGSYRIVDSEYELFKMVSRVPGAVGYVSEKVLLINSGDNYVRQVNITD